MLRNSQKTIPQDSGYINNHPRTQQRDHYVTWLQSASIGYYLKLVNYMSFLIYRY